MNVLEEEQVKVSRPEKAKVFQKEKCYHCGDECSADSLEHDEHTFCCVGCKTVYSILSKNGLDKFYQLNARAGTSQRHLSEQNYEHLENEELIQQLVNFTDGDFTRITFKLPQIHCSSCIWLLEKLPHLFEGVQSSKINFLRREADVCFYRSQISLRQLVEQLSALGYTPDLKLDATQKQKKDHLPPQFLLRLGVAGFCFGNLMLLSFPEYLGLPISEEEFPRFFGYLNIILSLPVLLFSGANYFKDAWASLQHKTLSFDVPIALGIAALFSRSVFEILTQVGAGYLDSLAALVFLLLVGQWFQRRTFDSVSFERDYQAYFPLAALVLDKEEQKSVALADLEIGQTVLVKNGQLIPADGELISGKANIDYSFVSGESEPIVCSEGERLYAGGRQWGEPLRIKLLKTVSQSYLMQLWNSDTFQKDNHFLLKNLTQRWGKNFTVFVLLVAFVSGGYWLYTAGWQMAINVFTSVLIVACPCALALNIPFSFGNARQILAKKLLFLKNTDHIEELSAKKAHIIFDKTGTLTSSIPSAIWKGEPLSTEEQQAIAALSSASLHPISRAIYESTKSLGEATLKNFEETVGAGTEGRVNDTSWKIGKRDFTNALSTVETNQSLAYVSKEDKSRGYFELVHPLRPEIMPMLQQLKQRGFTISLLSGDSEREAYRFVDVFGKENLHFNQKPSDKLDFLKKLQTESNQPVWMVGDGLNDAGALKQSDFGIAISEDEQQFSPACDAILRASKLTRLDRFMSYARKTIWVVRLGLVVSLLYNLVGLSFAVSGQLSPLVAAILMPLSSLTVVGLGVSLTWLLGRDLSSSD